MRTLLAALAAAGTAALGGVILGEYTLANVVALVAGLLFGVVVAEAVVAVQRRPAPLATAAATVLTPMAWVWSLWISTGHHLGYASVAQWAATPVAGLAALGWIGFSRPRGR